MLGGELLSISTSLMQKYQCQLSQLLSQKKKKKLSQLPLVHYLKVPVPVNVKIKLKCTASFCIYI